MGRARSGLSGTLNHAPCPSRRSDVDELSCRPNCPELSIFEFVAWKQAAWSKFLNDELEMGQDKASEIWIENFWKALDRTYGGNISRFAVPAAGPTEHTPFIAADPADPFAINKISYITVKPLP